MERIRTRIIIAVAERLSGAKDSNAKTELIEELSENLYQRYLDLAASSVSEEEAYRRAMERSYKLTMNRTLMKEAALTGEAALLESRIRVLNENGERVRQAAGRAAHPRGGASQSLAGIEYGIHLGVLQ